MERSAVSERSVFASGSSSVSFTRSGKADKIVNDVVQRENKGFTGYEQAELKKDLIAWDMKS